MDKHGRDILYAHQASARGGFLKAQVQGDRVVLSGKAVTVLEGISSSETLEQIFLDNIFCRLIMNEICR